MQDLPHHYTVTTRSEQAGAIDIEAAGLATIVADAPVEFGGPGDRWSPESLLVASVASCLMLSFRAIARASKLEWDSLSCEVTGTLDRVERVTRFTAFELTARLSIGADVNEDKALRILDKAKAACLITNSLSAETTLNASVVRS